MKNIVRTILIAVVPFAVASCTKTKTIPPTRSAGVDTSKTRIDNISLVGNWNIVTDTISYNGHNTMYHGTPGDHYIFTRYGNLYINEGLENLIDTAIYTVSTLNNQVSWNNLYFSANGQATTIPSNSQPYVITSLDSISLTLTQNAATASGPRYEQIRFRKK